MAPAGVAPAGGVEGSYISRCPRIIRQLGPIAIIVSIARQVVQGAVLSTPSGWGLVEERVGRAGPVRAGLGGGMSGVVSPVSLLMIGHGSLTLLGYLPLVCIGPGGWGTLPFVGSMLIKFLQHINCGSWVSGGVHTP